MRVQPAGGRRDERDAGDPVAEQLGVLLGEGYHGHAAHRVPDQDQPSLGGDLVDDLAQVVAELVDGGVAWPGAAAAAVGALVVEHGADQAAVAGPLEVPAVEVERVAVHEHDGHLRGVVAGAASRAALRAVLVDLDVEGNPVLRDHGAGLGPERAEPGRLAVAALGDHAAPAGDADRGPGGRQPGGPGGVRQDAAAEAHAGVSSESTVRRAKRPPMRVTIS